MAVTRAGSGVPSGAWQRSTLKTQNSKLKTQSYKSPGSTMADLLECLIQIKALAETPRRLKAWLDTAPLERWTLASAANAPTPLEVVACLAEMEQEWSLRLHRILEIDDPRLDAVDEKSLSRRPTQPGWSPDQAVAHFTARRLANLRLLDRCSAPDLSREGLVAGRGKTTVADVVALMLAHDTEQVGQILQALGGCGRSS